MAFMMASSYMALLSLILFIMMYIDKRRAKRKEWRISEKTLMTLAVFGGACGGIVGMYVFRHKTKHPLFTFGFSLLAVIQIFMLVQLYR